GVPLPAAKEFHSSIALMSAVVVPTAADMADGLTFAFDMVGTPMGTPRADGTCDKGAAEPCRGLAHFARSLGDLEAPCNAFHRAKVRCRAEGRPYPQLPPRDGAAPPSGVQATPPDACLNLTFDSIFRSSH